MSVDVAATITKVSTWGGTDMAEVTFRIPAELVDKFHVMDDIVVNVREH